MGTVTWRTAGESHGEALVGIIEGIPAGVAVSSADIAAGLARRRAGHGRGARMALEADQLRLLGGVWRGRTLGSPIAIEIANTEWPVWRETMSPDPAPVPDSKRAEPLTRPRPGHADLAGMLKYGHSDARAVLERSSARETAARVALGTVAARLLDQALGVQIVSHVVGIGQVLPDDAAPHPTPADAPALDASPVRAVDGALASRLMAEVDGAQQAGDTIGGTVEVLCYGLPVGLGSHVQADRRLDARLAGALMSIPAVKGVEIGDGMAFGRARGSEAHDEIVLSGGGLDRASNHAGGIEGGMSNGQVIRARIAVKPIPTVPRALRTVDMATGEPATAHHQRSDTSAVVPAAVVAEAMCALVLADATVEKFGGDSLEELRDNIAAYRARIEARCEPRREEPRA
ncbi:MAG: chorismate synthase [Bifidobacteriaceae bacterium]|jgi:chorismate synthase|nr:chorismate synthase [Bifidobacteriaceae bacterium]